MKMSSLQDATYTFSAGIAIIAMSLFIYHPSSATAAVTELPFLDLGDETRVNGDGKFFGVLDGAKNVDGPIRMFISSKGLLSFDSAYLYPIPRPFPINNQQISVIAPYWSDTDLRFKGLVLYASMYGEREYRLNSSQAHIVNDFITDTILKECKTVFRAYWIQAIRWINVCPSGNGNCDVTKSNSFQVVIAADFVRQYIIFTYKCGELNWMDPINYAGIGFSAHVYMKFAEHPLSRKPNVNDIACINNDTSVWSNVVYTVSNRDVNNEVTFDPPQFVSEMEPVPYKIGISLSSVDPIFDDEPFLCVFTNEERGIAFNTSLSKDRSCDLTSSLPALTDIKLVTRVNFYSSLSKHYFCKKIEFTFYNCSRGNNCRDCVSDGVCGWCGNTCVHASATCSTNFISAPCGCYLSPHPIITSISPKSGPVEGGTRLIITGTDLGASFGDIINITVGSLSCTPIEDSYLVGKKITCDINSGNQTQLGNVNVAVRLCNITTNQSAASQFRFGQPRVYSVSPSYGPAAGGTMVRVRGEDLNIGNKERTSVSLVTAGSTREQSIEKPSCDIISISQNEIICNWSNFTAEISGVVAVAVNSAMVQNNSVTYQYLNNPVYNELTPQQTIRAGGIKLTFTGKYLNVSQQQRLQFNNGLQNATVMCNQSSSGTTLVCIAPPLSVLNNYTIIMDAAPGPDAMDNDLRLSLVDDPVALGLRKDSRKRDLGVNDSTISINGQHIANVDKEEIIVMVGRDQCVVETTSDTVITCIAPQRDEPVMESVIVLFGQNIKNNVGQLQYIAGANTAAAIAGGITGGVVLILLLVLSMFSVILYCYLLSISKYKNELERAQQPVYEFVPHGFGQGDGEIEVKNNIGYLKSVGIGSLSPVGDEDVNHIYEELPYDEPLATEHNENGQENVDGQAMRDDDGYYVNDDLFPEEYKMSTEPKENIARKNANEAAIDDAVMKDDGTYYANDDLFPEEYKKSASQLQEEKMSAD